jgi:O-antigen/teichoic acid export membrane protein
MGKYISKAIESLKTLWKKGAFHIFIGNFATKFVTFFGSIVLAKHLLSKTDYGLLGYMENLCSFAYIFAGLGLSYALLRYSILSDEVEKKFAYYKYAVTRGFAFNVLLIVVMVVFNMFYTHTKGFEEAYKLLPILILALPFQHLISDNQINERAMFNNKRFAFFSVASATCIVLARVFGAYFGAIRGVVIGIVLSNLLFGLFLTFSEYRKYFYKVKAAVLTREEKKVSTSYAVQYMITNGLWAMFMLIDTFLIGRMIADPTVLADYRVAYVFPGNMAIVSGAIGLFVGPYFVKHENDRAWIKKNYVKTFFATAAVVGAVVLLLYICTPLLIRVCYGEQYMNTVSLMRILLVSCFINTGMRYTTANLLASMGQVKYNMYTSALGMATQIVLDIILIPKYGTYGVAFAGIVTYSIMAIILFIVFNRKYGIIGRSDA